jgi:hypothetical protein
VKIRKINKVLKSVILSAGLLVGTANAALIHSYSFSGNANDETGSANGSVSGAVLTSDRFGNANSAYLFDGNNSIVASFGAPATATFSVWATWDRSGNDMLFNSGANQQGPDLFFVANACGPSISWNIWDSCNNRFAQGIPAQLSDGNFHHYVLVNNAAGNTATLYIDGVLFGAAGYRAPGATFTIGSEGLGGSNFGWSGKIDDIGIYNTALDSEAVARLYTQVPEPSTLAILALGLIGLSVRRFKK